jgi:SAM-dependent methyltransferase
LQAVRAEGKLLELGCGSGDFTRSAAKAGYEAFGLDFNPNSSFETGVSNDTFTFIHADVEKTEFEPHRYDIVCAFDVLEHCDDLKGLLTRIHRSLNAHGILAITVPNAESLLHYLCLTAHKITFSSFGRQLEGIFVISHPIYFSLLSLSYLLETCHFKVVRHYQSSTDLTKIRLSSLFRSAVEGVFMLSRLCSLQNRLVIFARKN